MKARLEAQLRSGAEGLALQLDEWPALDRRLEAAALAVGRVRSRDLRKRLRQRVNQLARRLKLARHDDLAAPSMHRLRITVKKLRYETELAAPASPELAADLLDRLEPLQEALGTLHDTDVRLALLKGGRGVSRLVDSETEARAALAALAGGILDLWREDHVLRRIRRAL